MSSSNEGLEELLKVLEKVPFVSSVTRDVGLLKRVVYERRPPRLMVIGEAPDRASVLQSLGAQHVTFEGTWSRFEDRHRVVDVLESGVGLTGASQALAALQPDVILMISESSRVEGGVGDLLEAVLRVSSLSPGDDVQVPAVIPVLVTSENDLLGDVLLKQFRKQITDSAIKCEPAMEVSGHVGVGPLADAIARAMPDSCRIDTIRAFQVATQARRELANELVRSCSTLAITVALSPVPLSDIAIIAPLQVVMVSAVSYLSGRSWDAKSSAEWIGSLGLVGSAGLGFRWGAQQLVKLIPGAGSMISAGIAGTGTAALGRAAIRYFIGPPPGLVTIQK